MVEAGTDLVAVWEVHLADGIHVIEFEHGTTSGKRVLKVDREVILKNDWMFKLVGTESFKVGKNKTPCTILIEPVEGFTYQYSLEVGFDLNILQFSFIFYRLLGSHSRNLLRTRTRS